MIGDFCRELVSKWKREMDKTRNKSKKAKVNMKNAQVFWHKGTWYEIGALMVA